MDSHNVYQPISCNFYDELEAIATLKKNVTIIFLDDQSSETLIEAKIVDLFIKNKVEFLKTDTEQTIRLDRLVKVDGKSLQSYC